MSCSTKGTPCILQAIGSYDIDFRLIIICREGFVSLLRRGWVEGKVLLQVPVDIVDAVSIPGDNFIVIATKEKTLQCYTKRVGCSDKYRRFLI